VADYYLRFFGRDPSQEDLEVELSSSHPHRAHVDDMKLRLVSLRAEDSSHLAKPQDSSHPAKPRALAPAERSLDLLAILVPSRIANEEIGDALEIIHAMARDQRPAWAIYLRVARTFFWVGMHTVQHHVVGWLIGIVKIATSQGDDRK